MYLLFCVGIRTKSSEVSLCASCSREWYDRPAGSKFRVVSNKNGYVIYTQATPATSDKVLPLWSWHNHILPCHVEPNLLKTVLEKTFGRVVWLPSCEIRAGGAIMEPCVALSLLEQNEDVECGMSEGNASADWLKSAQRKYFKFQPTCREHSWASSRSPIVLMRCRVKTNTRGDERMGCNKSTRSQRSAEVESKVQRVLFTPLYLAGTFINPWGLITSQTVHGKPKVIWDFWYSNSSIHVQ